MWLHEKTEVKLEESPIILQKNSHTTAAWAE